ncbi:MAG: DUF523 and DUF1722 domain-containing protein [Deltaproteobacteria bacterium]|nr:DUF523 and DUF1722 domain-containing protein [Deltaproteobacteria bacterium]
MPPDAPVGNDRPRLGVSRCLLGERVRFDGGHKHDRFLTDVLGRSVEWVPVCPELEMGLGVPREAVRLEGGEAAPRMVGVRTGRDHSRTMARFAAVRVRQLAGLGLHGYVFKRRSPSCGTARVRVYGGDGAASRRGRGLFAAAFMEALPLVPVEEEGRLSDPVRREAFMERVFAYRRWRALAAAPTRAALVAFHAAHELQLRAHSPERCRALGRAVAERTGRRPAALVASYGAAFMEALAVRATIAKQTRVLRCLGELCRGHLDAADHRELAGAIDAYRHFRAPLAAPLTLLRHHAEKHRVAGAWGQTYLAPHPGAPPPRDRV